MIAPPFLAVPPVRYGGTELVVATLAEALAARGHDVSLYASGDSAAAGVTLRSHYARAVWPPCPQVDLVHCATSIWDIVDRREIDVVHAHTSAAVAFAPLLRPPMVYTVHHAYEEATTELLHAATRGHLTTVAISARQRQILGSTLPAQVIHHGLPPKHYPPGDGAGGYAAFLGRFAAEKGVEHALDAAARAQVPIRVAGRPHPADTAYFAAEVQERLERPGVRWYGEVGQEAKVRMLGGAIATLFPATWEEPFGLVMIESMLCGTPVIGFPRGAVSEVIDEGVTGFLVTTASEMADRLARLARTRFDRRRCREVAVARFGADHMVDQYLALYRSIAAAPALAAGVR